MNAPEIKSLHGKTANLNGKQFARLTVIRFDGYHPHPCGLRKAKWFCSCLCGKSVSVYASNLIRGTTGSCGCRTKEEIAKALTKHGCARADGATKEWRAWNSMKRRCWKKSDKRYGRYGGRGIAICDRWKMFSFFLEDMGLAPAGNFTLGRIDNDGNYEPSNCRWETPTQQANNKCTSRFIEAFGKRQTLAEWSRYKGIDAETISARLKRGWASDEAVSSALMQNKYG